MSYWEELEILNEEDFSSPEEQESIAAAEKQLMEKFRDNEENCQQDNKDQETSNSTNTIVIQDGGNSSLKEDELPEGNILDPQLINSEDDNETDMFLNEEYKKMMPSQEESCPSIHEEDSHPQGKMGKDGSKSSQDEEDETQTVLDSPKEEK